MMSLSTDKKVFYQISEPMDYYALAKISKDGKVIEKLIESDDLKKDGIN